MSNFDNYCHKLAHDAEVMLTEAGKAEKYGGEVTGAYFYEFTSQNLIEWKIPSSATFGKF